MDDDDDDFTDEDEEESSKPKSSNANLKISAEVKLLCTMIDQINEKYIPKAHWYYDDWISFKQQYITEKNLGSYNEYYPLAEHNFFRHLECSGMTIWQP